MTSAWARRIALRFTELVVLRRLAVLILIPLGLVLAGTLGFHLLEGWSLFDSLYATVITLSTIGYGDFVPRTTAGRAFTIGLVLSGVFTLFFSATEIIRSVVSGEVADILGRRQMERELAQLKDHIIVCGFGRMGKLVCSEFARERVPFVIVDERETALKDFHQPPGIPLVGDATSDEVLTHAGVARARGLVTVMASDASNLFTTMSARLLNARLYIVARVENPHSEQKLLRAGANRVVSPYQIGGVRVAHAMLKPTVVDFIDLATRTGHIELQMEEARIGPHSPLAGCKLRESRLRADLRVIIVAIKRKDGEMLFNPDPESTLQAGDILVAIGHKEHLRHLEELANPREGAS
jgi:voltage-gated potassium channel